MNAMCGICLKLMLFILLFSDFLLQRGFLYQNLCTSNFDALNFIGCAELSTT